MKHPPLVFQLILTCSCSAGELVYATNRVRLSSLGASGADKGGGSASKKKLQSISVLEPQCIINARSSNGVQSF